MIAGRDFDTQAMSALTAELLAASEWPLSG